MKYSRVLVSCFEAFDASGLNASQLVAEALKDELDVVRLPNHWKTVDTMLLRALEASEPAVLLMLGQGAGSSIRIERLAVNMDTSSRPDSANEVRIGKIVNYGPLAISATSDVDDIVGALRREGHVALASSEPGGHLCNHAFYLALHTIEATNQPVTCVFVHLPRTVRQELALPSVQPNDHYQPLSELAAAVRVVLAELQRQHGEDIVDEQKAVPILG